MPPPAGSRACVPGAPAGGFGLTVVRGVVEAHGGTIDVHSDADEGMTFRVRLPLDAGAARDRTTS